MFNLFKRKLTVKFKQIDSFVSWPKKGTKYSAGYDIFACETVNISPKTFRVLVTGLAIEIPKGYFGLLAINNSLTLNKNIQLYNGVGIIDSDYRGELVVSLYNSGDMQQKILKYEPVAQLIILPSTNAKFKQVEQLTETERNSIGFCAAKKKENI